MTTTHCPACARAWTDHPSLSATCVSLQSALWEIERLRAELERLQRDPTWGIIQAATAGRLQPYRVTITVEPVEGEL